MARQAAEVLEIFRQLKQREEFLIYSIKVVAALTIMLLSQLCKL